MDNDEFLQISGDSYIIIAPNKEKILFILLDGSVTWKPCQKLSKTKMFHLQVITIIDNSLKGGKPKFTYFGSTWLWFEIIFLKGLSFLTDFYLSISGTLQFSRFAEIITGKETEFKCVTGLLHTYTFHKFL